MRKVTEIATPLAERACASLGLELWDVEFGNEGGRRVLRVYADKENGIGISDCEALSRALEPLLDTADIYEGAYVLEVSSPGMERTLKKPAHFARYTGEQVEVKLYAARDGVKSYTGTLVSRTDENLTIRVGEAEISLAQSDISKVKLKPDYSKYFSAQTE